MSPWLQLGAGWDAIERPYEIADDLLREFGVGSATERRDTDLNEPYHVTSRGSRGSEAAGYRWTETRSRDTNEWISCTIETFGLAGLDLVWTFTLDKSGYEYRFRHGSLRARFESPDTQRSFSGFWHGKAGRRPELSALMVDS